MTSFGQLTLSKNHVLCQGTKRFALSERLRELCCLLGQGSVYEQASETLFTSLTEEICDYETYTVGTSVYNTTGIYTDTLSSVVTGCDSIVTLDLTVHPTLFTDLTEEICDGETYTVGTSDYTTSGNYVD
ncbi:hypothetical protein IX84_12805, partial [Phaeodactylibacter xiamenensis]